MRKSLFVTSMILAGASLAQATALLPGQTVFKTNASVPYTPKYTGTLPPFASGGNLVGTLTAPLTGGFIGTIRSDVYRDPANGHLEFQYTLAMSDLNTADVVRATMGGWMNVSITDAGANAAGSSGTFDPAPEWTDGDPFAIARDPTTQGIEFQWRQALGPDLIGTVIGPGDTSSTAFLTTTVTQFTQGTIAFIDTSVTGNSNVLVPLPEPASLALLALGGLLKFRRR